LVVHACNLSTQEAEAGELQASISYKARPCLKKTKPKRSLCQWFIPIILATGEAKIGRIIVPGQQAQKFMRLNFKK
jgi:hypothetical protein